MLSFCINKIFFSLIDCLEWCWQCCVVDVNVKTPDKKSIMMYLMCFFQVLPHSNIPTPSDDLPPSTPSSATDNRNFQFTDHNSNKEVSPKGMLGNGLQTPKGKLGNGHHALKRIMGNGHHTLMGKLGNGLQTGTVKWALDAGNLMGFSPENQHGKLSG